VKSSHSVNFSPDGERVIAASGSFEAIKLWDFHSQQELLTLPANAGLLLAVKFHGNGDIISAFDSEQTVYCWRAPSFEEIRKAEAGQ
jgi:WD40 repeat protein